MHSPVSFPSQKLLIDIDTLLPQFHLCLLNLFRQFSIRFRDVIERRNAPTKSEEEIRAEGDQGPQGQLRAFAAIKEGIVFETAGEDDILFQQAATTLKVAFNLCHDYRRLCFSVQSHRQLKSPAPAQIATFKAGYDRAILHHVHTCLFINKDDTTELALELLGDLSQHLKDVEPDAPFGKDFISQLLRLPCYEDVDQDTFLDIAAAISPYIANSGFQEETLATDQVDLTFKLLDRTIFLLANSPSAEQGKAFESLLLQSISEISTLPSFPASFSSNTKLISTLTARCILTENDSDSVSPAVCACILLGNYSSSQSAAMAIVAQVNTKDLYSHMALQAFGRSRASQAGLADYLHAAAGMLRHLAQWSEVRAQHFTPPDEAKSAAAGLLQFSHGEVQIAGLRLFRQLVHGDASALEAAIHAGHAAALQKLFADTSATDKIRHEIARTVAALLRASDPKTIQTFVGADARALDPLSFAAQAKYMPLANAEAYFAFFLLARASTCTRAAVSERLRSDTALLAALRTAIVVQSSSNQHDASRSKMIEDASSTDPVGLPIQGHSNAASVALRARDNAVVLLSEMLTFDGLDPEVREELDSVAGEAGITLRLG
ncbi:hypothetical protein ANO11243_021510 [Dothideomycetidae sp. 11243]|nr:hypothetical protein ANO11243_021510 [fungal sp. No.11243]